MLAQYTPKLLAAVAGAILGACSFATQAASISNGVTDNAIAIDANLSDWASIASLGYDADTLPDFNAQADILEAWLANDSSNLYLAYRNNGDINTSFWWSWQVYFDTDENAGTGFRGAGSVGAEYLLQGSGMYRYVGSGSDWSWQFVSGTTNKVNGAIAEFKIPRASLGSPTKLRAVFKARNGAFTGDFSAAATDTYPKAFAPISIHDDLLYRQYAIWTETGGTQWMNLASSAAAGSTQLRMSANYPLVNDQLITYRGTNGEYYTGQVASINGTIINLKQGLQTAVGAGSNVWNFYEDGSHPNEFGFRAIADFAIRKLGLASLNQGRHVLFGDSWFDSPGVGERLQQRMNNAVIINEGVGGNTSTALINRFDTDVVNQNPDYVWVIAGVNDYHRDVPASTYLANMQGIISKISSIGAQAIVYNSPVGQLFFGSDSRTQLSHAYADGLGGGSGDGYVEYTLANVTVTPPSEVSNPANISIDGSLADWAALDSFGVDGNDINMAASRADYIEGWMAHNDNNLFIAYQNDGAISTGTWWPWQTYLDTDRNSNTGYQIGNGVGAEYVVQGRDLYRYFGTGTNWAWTYVASAIYSVNGNIVEMSFPRSALGGTSKLNAIMKTRNGIFTGDYSLASVDSYPNLNQGNLSYNFGEGTTNNNTFSNRVANFSINLNGDLSDWSGVTSFGRDADDITDANFQADWLEAWAAHDNNNLYFAYENDGQISNTRWPWQIYIDADNNASTGYKATNSIGAEYVIEGTNFRQYRGNGNNWSWNTLAVTGSSTVGSFAEIAIPLSVLNGSTDFRVVFRTTNQPFTGNFNASGVDYFPNSAANSADGYFSYSIR